MKGKKVDPIFVSNFMSTCLAKGFLSKNDIVTEAKKQIEEIDCKIKEVELLKISRSKLVDVISMMSEEKKDTTQQKKTLTFLNIHNPKVCKYICDILNKSSILISDIKKIPSYNDEFILVLKQLQDNHIISRVGNSLVRGESFYDYYSFISHDGKL